MTPSSLQGILVADFSRVLAGPYATIMLADLGADVVKAESPDGDDTRRSGPPYADGEATYFLSVNRNKRSIRLDLRDPADQELARELVRRADVLVQAMGGLMSVTGAAEPTKVGVALVDVLTGLHATICILAALRHKDATGAGQHVQVDLLHCQLSSLVNQASALSPAGSCPHGWATGTRESRRTPLSDRRRPAGAGGGQRPAVRGVARGAGPSRAGRRSAVRRQPGPGRPPRRTG
jgi:crotonobetainyl-CoA:carnitine CoA-transferase CaiB-like acyl-CoA transferase